MLYSSDCGVSARYPGRGIIVSNALCLDRVKHSHGILAIDVIYVEYYICLYVCICCRLQIQNCNIKYGWRHR